MSLYAVSYYYLATGMEGIPDERDYGVHEAESPEAAKRKAIEIHDKHLPPSTKEWVMGCLSAKKLAD